MAFKKIDKKNFIFNQCNQNNQVVKTKKNKFKDQGIKQAGKRKFEEADLFRDIWLFKPASAKIIRSLIILLIIWSCDRKPVINKDLQSVNTNIVNDSNNSDRFKEVGQYRIQQTDNENLTIEERVKRLSDSYQSYAKSEKNKSSDTVKFQQQFFYAFPDNFIDFEEIYGFDDSTGNEAPLYKDLQYYHHIKSLFNKLNIIDKIEYYTKLINLSIGGKWDADNVSLLQSGLRRHVYDDINLTTGILSKYKDEEIRSFWYFFFDEPHPNEKLPNELKQIKDKRIYDLMFQSYQQVLKGSSVE
jgi:hypothetical protein